jgi:hypothetical protein
MSDLQFDEPQPDIQRVANLEPSGLLRLIIRYKLADDTAGANKVAIGIAVAAFLLTLIIIFRGSIFGYSNQNFVAQEQEGAPGWSPPSAR